MSLCMLLKNFIMFTSVFSNNHSAMCLIIINLNSFFKATGITKSSYISILQIFIKYIKLVAQENIQIMKTQCCIIVVSIVKLRVLS